MSERDDLPGPVPVHAAAVESALAEFLAAKTPEHATNREWARHHRALPLVADMGGCILLRPTGELVAFAWDAEIDVAPLTDAMFRHVARAVGARKFPGIRGLAPVRGPDSRVCDGCAGTGRVLPEAPGLVCMCGNTGWLPA